MSANGEALINSLMYDVGKVQVLTTDTNYRVMALDWLNRILRDIAGRHSDWNWLQKSATFNTVADQMSYDLPTDLLDGGFKIYDMRQKESPSPIVYIDQRRFDELEPDPTDSSGNPFYYTLYADTLRLWPVPDDVYAIYMRYVKNITTMTDGATTCETPVQYDDVVVDGMKVHAFRYEPEWGDTTKQKIIYESGIQRMIRDNDLTLDDDGVTERHGYGTGANEAYSFDSTSVG